MDNLLSSDLTITSQGFGLMRKALIENMGGKRANEFLFRFGKDLGVSKATELKNRHLSTEAILKVASEVHTNLGHVSGIESNGTIIILEDGRITFENAYGKWFNSFEARLHQEHFGPSSNCTCYTLSGFASGYLSTIYKQEIYVKETTCKAMGYAECSFELNTKAYYLHNEPENELLKKKPTMYEELSLTYDTLLTQKKMLNKVLTYHSQLTDCVTRDNSLYHVLTTAYDIVKIPIVIKNVNNKVITANGITEGEYAKLTSETNNHIVLNKHYETIYEKIGNIYEMRAPINLDQKPFGSCSFIYKENQLVDDNDFLFIERLASVATLCFMKERISFETTERLKISFLDRLINEPHTSSKEISSRLSYISSNIEGPYYMLTIKCTASNSHLPIDLYEQLLQFSKTLKLYYIDGLLTLHQSEIVVLIYNGKPIKKLVTDLNKMAGHIQKNNPSIRYKIGSSMQFSSLPELSDHLKQAKHAADFPRNQPLIIYEELGILAHFLANLDIEIIKKTAIEELKDLSKADAKNKELLYTLYTYLVNGRHLEKTMQDLALSMGGVQYRIRKIEEITQKNLKDFYTSSYLLLLIESLITLGEIKW